MKMEELTVEKVTHYLTTIRNTLLIGIISILTMLFICGCIEDVKLDIQYLQESYAKLRENLENKSLFEMKGDLTSYTQQYEFKKMSDIEMDQIKREIQILADNVKKSKKHSGINEEELERYDLAFYSAGGRVSSVHNTNIGQCSFVIKLLGFCNRAHPPEKALTSDISPDQCFCFHGNKGEFTIRLAYEARLDGITVEHISKSMTPTSDISSAPKSFSIIGMKEVHDKNGFNFGDFEFDPHVATKKVFTLPNESDEKFR